MTIAGWIVLAIVLLTVFGFLSPLIPLLWIFRRTIDAETAAARVRIDEGVVTYNSEMGWLHRVWWSPARPITSHWRAVLEGTLVWMPFSSCKTVNGRFDGRCITVDPGHRLDMVMDDGRTFFEHVWESKRRRPSVTSNVESELSDLRPRSPENCTN